MIAGCQDENKQSMQREQHLEMHGHERGWFPCTATRSSLWLSIGSVGEETGDGATLYAYQAKVFDLILWELGSSLVFHQENRMLILGRRL